MILRTALLVLALLVAGCTSLRPNVEEGDTIALEVLSLSGLDAPEILGKHAYTFGVDASPLGGDFDAGLVGRAAGVHSIQGKALVVEARQERALVFEHEVDPADVPEVGEIVRVPGEPFSTRVLEVRESRRVSAESETASAVVLLERLATDVTEVPVAPGLNVTVRVKEESFTLHYQGKPGDWFRVAIENPLGLPIGQTRLAATPDGSLVFLSGATIAGGTPFFAEVRLLSVTPAVAPPPEGSYVPSGETWVG